jgi:hypothetical protein
VWEKRGVRGKAESILRIRRDITAWEKKKKIRGLG